MNTSLHYSPRVWELYPNPVPYPLSFPVYNPIIDNGYNKSSSYSLAYIPSLNVSNLHPFSIGLSSGWTLTNPNSVFTCLLIFLEIDF